MPGGLTNRAEPAFWVQTLRPDPDTKPREWRKFKNETLKPAVAEISQRTSLEIKLVEYKQGRAVVSVQFAVKRKLVEREMTSLDLSMVERAAALGIKEKDLDHLTDEFGDEQVAKGIDAMLGRMRAKPNEPIKHALVYLRKTLRNGFGALNFANADSETSSDAPRSGSLMAPDSSVPSAWLSERKRELNERLDQLDAAELEKYVEKARATMRSVGTLTNAMQKRLDGKQYRTPMVWEYIRAAYAEEHYGADWKAQA